MDEDALTTPARAAGDGGKGVHGGAMRWLSTAFTGRQEVVVLPTTAPAALRRQVRRACREYASSLGVRLPPLEVALAQEGVRRSGSGSIGR